MSIEILAHQLALLRLGWIRGDGPPDGAADDPWTTEMWKFEDWEPWEPTSWPWIVDHWQQPQATDGQCQESEDDEAAVWEEVLRPPVPPRGYVCRICSRAGHYITYCDRAPPRCTFRTPYQGEKRCFGLFQCAQCQRQWISHNSWAELGQHCRRCKLIVFPTKQFPFDQVPARLIKMTHPRSIDQTRDQIRTSPTIQPNPI